MDTRSLKMLSGAEIVDKGRNSSSCILPEVGTKEVISNGSWLEKKQIQTALDARKVLVAVERIDKIGALSHAEWRDSMQLAEVTHQVGGHWQFIGHNVNGTFFLLPEEALYLMETSALLLKHNGVTVSLQKAYNMLLDGLMTLTQYKVYASLSRVGYKVFRHKKLTTDCTMKARVIHGEKIYEMDTGDDENSIVETSEDNTSKCESSDLAVSNISNNNSTLVPLHTENNSMNIDALVQTSGTLIMESTEQKNGNSVNYSIDENGVIRPLSEDGDIEMETVTSSKSALQSEMSDADTSQNPDQNSSSKQSIYKAIQLKIKKRKAKHLHTKILHDTFKTFPDFYENQIVKIGVPSEEHLPRNIFLNKTSYVINSRSSIPNPVSETPVRNRALYRTIRSSSESESAAIPTPDLPQYLPNTPFHQQPYGCFPNPRAHYQQQTPSVPWRFNQHSYFYRLMHTLPPTSNTVRPRPLINTNHNGQRFQPPTVKDDHLHAIKHLAGRLKNLQRPSSVHIGALMGLVMRYNDIYNEKMQIGRNLSIISPQEKIETIDLDQVQTIKPKLNEKKFDRYLDSMKELVARLNNVDRKKQSISKYRRAICNLVKNFNKAFDADYYLDAKGELIDKKLVVLDSSSDSDVIATDDNVTNKKRKRSSDGDGRSKKHKVLRNPFSILNEANQGASTSKAAMNNTPDIPVNNSKDLSKYFDKNWLRSDDDFGKPAVCSKLDFQHLRLDSRRLYDYLNNHEFENWVDLKVAYFGHSDAVFAFEHDLTAQSRDITADSSKLKPILEHDLTADWTASLEKLRIIKTNTDMEESGLRIHFDVYNRDVQNFKKTDPPKPHFRIICVEESSKFPTGAELQTLHGNYNDNVSIVFAIVGVGSIAYLQMKPMDLPVYVGND